MIDIKKIEQLGAADYYLDLKKFINDFIRRNYPLDKDDIRALTTDATTPNIEAMQKAKEVMEDEAASIIASVMRENEQFIKGLNEGKAVRAKTQEDYNNEIYNYKQQILERLYNYKCSIEEEQVKSR